MEPKQLHVYRGCTPAVDTYAKEDESMAVAVVEAVAAAAGVDPQVLPPLYDFINPDALDDLFTGTGFDGEEGIICFTFDQWNIFVSPSGRIRVCDSTHPTAEPEPVFATQ